MKKLVGLVIILVGLVLSGYYVTGIVAERTVQHNLDIINKSNGLSVSLVKYNRGWYTSTALLNWRLHIPEHLIKTANGQSQTVVAAQNYTTEMPLTIYHGPIIFTKHTIKFGLAYASTSIQLPIEYKKQFDEHFTSKPAQPKLALNFLIDYFNHSKINMSIPAFTLITKNSGQLDGSELDWMGMHSSVNVTSSAKKINGKITVDGMQITKNDIQVVMGSLVSQYNVYKVSDENLYVGDANLSFPSFIIMEKGKKLFELIDLAIHSHSNVHDKLLSAGFKSSIDKIVISDKTFGPGNLDIELRNLDADVLADINQKVHQAQQKPDSEKQQALLAILPQLPKLFNRAAEFEISTLRFVMPQGTIEGHLLIALPENDNNNIFDLLQKIHGNGKLRAPSSAVKIVLNQIFMQVIALGGNKEAEKNAQAAPHSSQVGTAETNANIASSTTTATTVSPSASTTPPNIAEQAAIMSNQQLNAMLQSGLLVQDGNYYSIDFILEQGKKLQINGKSLN